MKTTLTIAGSDCSGGAGIQADLKTFAMHNVYGMSVITALTAQNTMGVRSAVDVKADFIAHQMSAVFEDIKPDAVKIGMVSNSATILTLATNLKKYEATNIVVDPVMVSTSGASLLQPAAAKTMVQYLLPLATIITPNLAEAEILSQTKITSENHMQVAAIKIHQLTKTSVLVKGGNFEEGSNDFLLHEGKGYWFKGPKVENENTHGTGCTLSSAIAANLAKGFDVVTAVLNAKKYVTGAIEAQLDLGEGRGPLNHCYIFDKLFVKKPVAKTTEETTEETAEAAPEESLS